MEVIVSCCVALLTASGVSGALWCMRAGARVPLRERVPMLGERAVKVLQGCGALLLDAGVPSRRMFRSLARELRALTVRGRRVLAGFDDACCLGFVLAGSALSALLVGVLSWSLIGALLGLAAPAGLLAMRAHLRARGSKTRVEEAMPEAFGALAISLGSGLSLAQAMHYVGSHAEEPVRSEFLRVSFAINCGVSAAEALDSMVTRLSAPGLEMVSLALKISQRTGAPLKDLLAEAAQLAGDRIELARRLDVKTSQARMSAQMVAAMPMVMVALLALLSSDFRRGLATTTGAASVCLALALNIAAWMVIRHIMNVDLS